MNRIQHTAVDWRGWPLDKNPHGKYFDASARVRMIRGSRQLLPLIYKYKDYFRGDVLEVGPFFVPLIIKRDLRRHVTYIENDMYAVAYLENKGFEVKDINLNTSDLSKIKKRFGVLIISQVLNYVDYEKVLRNLKKLLKKGSYVFINEVIDYGIPKLFSEKRARKDSAILDALRCNGLHIVEVKKIKVYSNQTKNKRLLVAAKI